MEIINARNEISLDEEVGGTRACIFGCLGPCVGTAGVATVTTAFAWAL